MNLRRMIMLQVLLILHQKALPRAPGLAALPDKVRLEIKRPLEISSLMNVNCGTITCNHSSNRVGNDLQEAFRPVWSPGRILLSGRWGEGSAILRFPSPSVIIYRCGDSSN